MLKNILLNPLFLAILIPMGIIYITIMYILIAKNKKFAISIEKIFIGIFLFSISGATGVTVMPFKKLHFSNLYNVKTTPTTIIGIALVYLIFMFILMPRLSYTLRNFINSLLITLACDPFLSIFLLMVSLSCFWSDTLSVTLKASLAVLATTGMAIYLGKQYSWKELYSFWRWVNLFVVFWSVAQPNKIPHLNNAWAGILGHKNQFSFFMCQTAVLWLLNALYSPKQRNFSLAMGFLSLIALQGGASGASKILVIVLIALWFYLGFVKNLQVRLAFVSVILFLVVSICLSILIMDNLETIVVDKLGKDMTLTGRTLFWPQVIDHINQRPLLGYGVVGFWQPWRGVENPAGDIIVMKSQFIPPHSHNGFLDLTTELGWGGLFLFILSFFNNMAKGVVYLTRAKLPEAGLPLLLLTYILMTNLTETGLFGISSIWFWYIVLTVRLSLDTTGKG